MIRARKFGRQSGLTMIEVFIASIILVAIVGMSSYLVWNSARTVSSAESALQSELQAREFIGNLTKEVHQTRKSKLFPIVWNNALTIVPTTDLKSPFPPTVGATTPWITTTVLATPGADGIFKNPLTKLYNPGVAAYHSIRFKIPGKTMDLTTKNADWDKDSTSFSLAAYKANGNNDANYTTELQYWWEIETGGGFKNEGTTGGAGAGGFNANGVDDNLNGVIDEGVIKKLETTFDVAGNVIKRTLTTVVRDVAWDAANGRPSLVFLVPNSDATKTVYATADSEKRIFVSLTLEKADPRYPNKPEKNFIKTVHTYIDVRN